MNNIVILSEAKNPVELSREHSTGPFAAAQGDTVVLMKKYLTQKGLEKLKKELDNLKNVERKKIAARLKKAAAFGDLSENADYSEAKEAQGFLEGKIAQIKDMINNVIIMPQEKTKGFVCLGSIVFVSNTQSEHKFEIVGAQEASPLDGKISIDSPLGRSLFNKPIGAIITVSAPGGEIKYKILKIA